MRTIGSPIIPSDRVEKMTEEGYHYVDGARMCDIENEPDFADSVFISERDGWIDGVKDSGAYLRSFDENMVILIVHIEELTRMAEIA